MTGEGPYFRNVKLSGSQFIQDKNKLDEFIETYAQPLIAKMEKKKKSDIILGLNEETQKNKFKIEAIKKWVTLHPALNFSASIVEALSDLPTAYMPKDSVLVYFKKLLPYNKAAELYNVRTIPSNFLIDPQGKIVARNLRGADLENKLSELMK